MGSCSSSPKIAAGLGGGGAEESSTGKNPYLVSTDEDSGGGGGTPNESKATTAAEGDDGLTDLSQFKRDYSGRGQAGIATGGGKRGRKNKRAKAKDADMENLLNKYKRQGGAPSSATKNHLILQRQELPGMGVVQKDVDPFLGHTAHAHAQQEQEPQSSHTPSAERDKEDAAAPGVEHAGPATTTAARNSDDDDDDGAVPFSLPPPEPDEFDVDPTTWAPVGGGEEGGKQQQRTRASFEFDGTAAFGTTTRGSGDGVGECEEQVVEFHDVT